MWLRLWAVRHPRPDRSRYWHDRPLLRSIAEDVARIASWCQAVRGYGLQMVGPSASNLRPPELVSSAQFHGKIVPDHPPALPIGPSGGFFAARVLRTPRAWRPQGQRAVPEGPLGGNQRAWKRARTVEPQDNIRDTYGNFGDHQLTHVLPCGQPDLSDPPLAASPQRNIPGPRPQPPGPFRMRPIGDASRIAARSRACALPYRWREASRLDPFLLYTAPRGRTARRVLDWVAAPLCPRWR